MTIPPAYTFVAMILAVLLGLAVHYYRQSVDKRDEQRRQDLIARYARERAQHKASEPTWEQLEQLTRRMLRREIKTTRRSA